jgi:3-phosphoglycerate kinase
MTIKSLKKLTKLKGRIIILRTDFNVPMEKGKIKDDYRIKAGLETIKYLVERGARVVIISHLGDPAGKVSAALSLRPIAIRLRRLLGTTVSFYKETIGPSVQAKISGLPAGGVLLLENLRFHQAEYDNQANFSRALASLGDVYVNDAFSVSHRAQASVSAIKKHIPAYAGLLLEQEIKVLTKVIRPRKPLVVILGGAKISTKAPLIQRLYKNSRQVLIGGGLANNFFKQAGLEIGKSLYDADSQTVVKRLLRNKLLAAKLVLPLDVVVKRRARALLVKPEQVKPGDYILDIGPETIKLFSTYIKSAKTILWNGPLGKFEEKSFRSGTLSVGSLVAARSSGSAYGVVGGGETVAALELTGLAAYVDWVSTGGGATLSYIGGETMPGLAGIIND